MLAPHGVLHVDPGVGENHHRLVGVHALLEIGEDIVDLEARHLIKMVEYYLGLLLLVIPLAHFPGALVGQLAVVVVQVCRLADVALVVLAHGQLLDEPLFVVLLPVENRCQQTLLCVFLAVDVVLLLEGDLDQLQVTL